MLSTGKEKRLLYFDRLYFRLQSLRPMSMPRLVFQRTHMISRNITSRRPLREIRSNWFLMAHTLSTTFWKHASTRRGVSVGWYTVSIIPTDILRRRLRLSK